MLFPPSHSAYHLGDQQALLAWMVRREMQGASRQVQEVSYGCDVSPYSWLLSWSSEQEKRLHQYIDAHLMQPSPTLLLALGEELLTLLEEEAAQAPLTAFISTLHTQVQSYQDRQPHIPLLQPSGKTLYTSWITLERLWKGYLPTQEWVCTSPLALALAQPYAQRPPCACPSTPDGACSLRELATMDLPKEVLSEVEPFLKSLGLDFSAPASEMAGLTERFLDLMQKREWQRRYRPRKEVSIDAALWSIERSIYWPTAHRGSLSSAWTPRPSPTIHPHHSSTPLRIAHLSRPMPLYSYPFHRLELLSACWFPQVDSALLLLDLTTHSANASYPFSSCRDEVQPGFKEHLERSKIAYSIDQIHAGEALEEACLRWTSRLVNFEPTLVICHGYDPVYAKMMALYPTCQWILLEDSECTGALALNQPFDWIVHGYDTGSSPWAREWQKHGTRWHYLPPFNSARWHYQRRLPMKSSLDIPPGSILAMSVARKLDIALSREFCALVARLLDLCPELHYLVLGNLQEKATGEWLNRFPPHLHPRLQLRPLEEDGLVAIEWMRTAELYLDPFPFQGSWECEQARAAATVVIKYNPLAGEEDYLMQALTAYNDPRKWCQHSYKNAQCIEWQGNGWLYRKAWIGWIESLLAPYRSPPIP